MSIGSTRSAYDTSNCELFYCNDIDETEFEIFSASAGKPTTVSAEFLAKVWNINQDLATKAIDQNTHLNRKDHSNDLTKMFNTNDRMLRYKRIKSQFFTDTFFVTKSATSSRGHTCAQIFVSDKSFVAIYLMKSKSEFNDALQMFCKEVGVPATLVIDPSG